MQIPDVWNAVQGLHQPARQAVVQGPLPALAAALIPWIAVQALRQAVQVAVVLPGASACPLHGWSLPEGLVPAPCTHPPVCLLQTLIWRRHPAGVEVSCCVSRSGSVLLREPLQEWK